MLVLTREYKTNSVQHLVALYFTSLAMPLLSLPDELLLYVSERLESEKDINALAQANRRLYQTLDRFLYRYSIQCSKGSALSWASEHGQETTVWKFLNAGIEVQGEDRSDALR